MGITLLLGMSVVSMVILVSFNILTGTFLF
jgi:hypothetical protein